MLHRRDALSIHCAVGQPAWQCSSTRCIVKMHSWYIAPPHIQMRTTFVRLHRQDALSARWDLAGIYTCQISKMLHRRDALSPDCAEGMPSISSYIPLLHRRDALSPDCACAVFSISARQQRCIVGMHSHQIAPKTAQRRICRVQGCIVGMHSQYVAPHAELRPCQGSEVASVRCTLSTLRHKAPVRPFMRRELHR